MRLTAVDVEAIRSRLAADLVEVVSTRSGYDTDLHRLVVTFGARSEVLWLKRYRRQPGHALKEWMFLGERAPYGPLDLAEPLGYVDALQAVVIRHVPGRQLSARLVTEDCAHAGAWLASFHRSSMSETHPRELIAGDLRDRARDEIRTVESTARRWLEESADEDLVRVRTHGDFGPFNIVIGDGRGAVIDPSFERSIDRLDNYCSRYEDLARFLTCLDDEERTRRPMMLAFARAYASVAEIVLAAPLLACFLAKYGLQALADRWSGRASWALRAGIGGLLQGWRELADEMSAG